ncbi:MAG: phasin family protein [Oscillospiraceae bacterium]|nr:phasin family protein [Oscillospiraceae bacterium]
MSEKERSTLEKVFLAGVGAVAKTAEAASDLLDDLVKKGALTIEQSKEINEELIKKGEVTVEKGKALGEELKSGIKCSVNDATAAVQGSAVAGIVKNMYRLTPEELAKIRSKIDELENNDE